MFMVYAFFSTSDLYDWKTTNPPFFGEATDPNSLLETVLYKTSEAVSRSWPPCLWLRSKRQSCWEAENCLCGWEAGPCQTQRARPSCLPYLVQILKLMRVRWHWIPFTKHLTGGIKAAITKIYQLVQGKTLQVSGKFCDARAPGALKRQGATNTAFAKHPSPHLRGNSRNQRDLQA